MPLLTVRDRMLKNLLSTGVGTSERSNNGRQKFPFYMAVIYCSARSRLALLPQVPTGLRSNDGDGRILCLGHAALYDRSCFCPFRLSCVAFVGKCTPYWTILDAVALSVQFARHWLHRDIQIYYPHGDWKPVYLELLLLLLLGPTNEACGIQFTKNTIFTQSK